MVVVVIPIKLLRLLGNMFILFAFFLFYKVLLPRRVQQKKRTNFSNVLFIWNLPSKSTQTIIKVWKITQNSLKIYVVCKKFVVKSIID